MFLIDSDITKVNHTEMKTKQCFKCGEVKPLSEFYKHKKMADGHLNKCKSCAKSDVSLHRELNIEKVRAYDRARQYEPKRQQGLMAYQKRHRANNPKKYKAHTALLNAVRDGKIDRPTKCEVCGTECVPHGHHWSYEKENWLDVCWVCVNCHLDIHTEK